MIRCPCQAYHDYRGDCPMPCEWQRRQLTKPATIARLVVQLAALAALLWGTIEVLSP